MTNRTFYAQYCPYGINVSYDSMGGNAYEFYAFDTKAERDTWVDTHEFNGSNYVASAVTRRVVERVMGKYFKIVSNLYDNGLNVVLREHGWEY